MAFIDTVGFAIIVDPIGSIVVDILALKFLKLCIIIGKALIGLKSLGTLIVIRKGSL